MGTASDWLDIPTYADDTSQSAAVPVQEKSPAGANACGAYILEEMPEGASDISGEVPHLAEPDVAEIVFTNE